MAKPLLQPFKIQKAAVPTHASEQVGLCTTWVTHWSLRLQKSKGSKGAEASIVDAVQGGVIAAVSADDATDPVVIVKENADGPAMLVSSNGNAEEVNLQQTASGELRSRADHLALASCSGS